jgi:spermidine synthase
VLDDDPDQEPVLRRLRNGTILHGAQFVDPAHKMDVTTYYGDGSGVEVAIDQHPRRDAKQPLRIGVIGLGAGTIAALGQAGDSVHFYEINPAAVDFARHYFTFLSGSAAAVEITLGDARLSLERELRDPARQHLYDVMAIDAFSGDAIPVHLLTREAFALYREALREDGVLAVHVSNHYLDLPPIVRGLAAEQGRKVAMIETMDDDSRALDSSTWMLVTGNEAMLENAEAYATKPEPHERSLVWTDAFSSLLQVLKK